MDLAKKKLLLVEDEAIIALSEKKELEKMGYAVDHALNGEAAIAMAKGSDGGFDAILMDIDLGRGMEGTKAAETILKAADIPIVFLSSHVEPEIVAKTEGITSYGYVVKNSGIVVLDASIKMALKLFNEKTERTRAEKQVLKLKNLYAVLSQINQAIVRTISVGDLAKDVSRVAVQYGSFKFAWVGRHDIATREVCPLGYYGEPEAIVTGIKHSSDEKVEPSCLCARAISEGRPHVQNDLSFETGYFGLREELGRAGVASAAVFPVRVRGVVWGVFGVYSGEAGIFREREIALLEEAAMDVGYAIENIENEDRRREAEKFQALSAEVLSVLNEPLSLHETSRAILKLIKERIGFDAVGIRLKDQDDFPYFSEDGFEEKFLLAENSLAERDEAGMVCRDEEGNICLECTCGMVLSGKCGPPSDSVTEAGSLWTNDSLAATESLRGRDPRLKPRDRCSHDGYLSVALIPIRANGRTIGLLHINDRRRNRFTPESIAFFEGLTSFFGIAVERKSSEARLRDSEARYRLIADNAADVIWVLDPVSGKFTYVSPSVQRLRGYTVEEVMAASAKDALTPQSAELVARKISDTLPAFVAREGGIMSFVDEVDQPRKDGTVVHTEVTTTYMRGDHGKVEIVGVSRDITERKLAQEKLRQSEERFRLALARSPISVAVQDLDLRFTWAYNQLTRGADEIVGKTDFDLFPRDAERVVALKRRALESGQGLSERLWIESNGRNLFLDLYLEPLRNGRGDIDSLGVVAVNLTDSKRVEDRLQASEAMFRAVFDNAPVGISILDRERHVLESNKMMERIIRIGKDGMNDHAYLKRRYIREDGTEFPPQEMASSRAIAERRTVRDITCGIVLEDGSVVWTQVSASPLDLPDTSVVLIVHDITERKAAEEEGRRQLAEKEILLKEVHHRIKNNIASIEGLIRIQSNSSGSDEVKSALRESIARVESIRVLYEKLLASDDYQALSTKDYIESLVRSLIEVFPDHRSVKIETEIADLSLSSRKMVSMGIIINELITNIYKHAFEGRDSGLVRMELSQSGGSVRLVIKDDGIGIEEKPGASASSGLGLLIVKMLAEQLDGSFSMTRDKGTKSVLEFGM
jgi:PAS domain S-box-containing protein